MAERESIEQALASKTTHKVVLTNPQRGEKLGFLKLASANADMILVEMRAEVQKYSEIDSSVFELQKVLGLKKTPFRIECVDISHLSGTNTVASLVAFKNGRPDKSNYRKFIIKTVTGVDDFASMREVMTRRIRRLEEEGIPMPDLWVCDGGKGQVDATMQILKELGHVCRMLATRRTDSPSRTSAANARRILKSNGSRCQASVTKPASRF